MPTVVTEGHIDVGTTSIQLDTAVVTQSSSTDGDSRSVHREGVFLGDPVTSGKRVELEGFQFAAGTHYAVPVTGAELRALSDLITKLIEETRVSNLYLSRLVGEVLSPDDLEDY